jgi:hypothetical protein
MMPWMVLREETSRAEYLASVRRLETAASRLRAAMAEDRSLESKNALVWAKYEYEMARERCATIYARFDRDLQLSLPEPSRCVPPDVAASYAPRRPLIS